MNITTLWTGSLASQQSATLSANPFDYSVIYVVFKVESKFLVMTILPMLYTTEMQSSISAVADRNIYYFAYTEVALTSSTITVRTIVESGWTGSRIVGVYGIK